MLWDITKKWIQREELNPFFCCLFIEFFACQHFIGFFVFFNRLVDDVLRQEEIAVRVGFEPVADELLVIGRLGLAGLVAFEGPEAGAVRREHFVA